MIYLNNNDEYEIVFFTNQLKGKSLVYEYIQSLPDKERSKVLKYIEYLRQNKGVLDEPYTKHIIGKIRELRVDFSKNRYRIFFFIHVGKKIILLHAFLKNADKTPQSEINTALKHYYLIINSNQNYEN